MEIIGQERKMSIGKVAEVFGVTTEAIKKHVREVFPEIIVKGKTTYLNEYQITEIKKRMTPTTMVVSAVTDLKKQNTIILAMQYLQEGYNQMKERAMQAERKNAILMHVTKTYTASEIAKELGMRSAQQLNDAMCEKKMQYKQNGTWLPCADFADRGFFEIKQQELDSGRVIYDRKITQLGREFLIDMFTQVGE